MSKTAVIS